eukprot:10463992-Ditylum_brightwellii.AAC.1
MPPTGIFGVHKENAPVLLFPVLQPKLFHCVNRSLYSRFQPRAQLLDATCLCGVLTTDQDDALPHHLEEDLAYFHWAHSWTFVKGYETPCHQHPIRGPCWPCVCQLPGQFCNCLLQLEAGCSKP